MTNEVNKNLENLENDGIDGNSILGGGAGDINLIEVNPAGLGGTIDSIGANFEVIAMGTPMQSEDQVNIINSSEAPPIGVTSGVDVISGYTNGNT